MSDLADSRDRTGAAAKKLDLNLSSPDSRARASSYLSHRPDLEAEIVRKNPVIQFLAWFLLLNPPLFAQDAIQIEIDSAPVEVEIPKPDTPARQPEPAPAPKQAQTPTPPPEQKAEKDSGRGYGVAIGIGALVAGLLAALAGGGGGSGGGGSTPQHP